MTIESRLYGSYNFENILAAACIGCHFKVGQENVKAGIEMYEASNNRSQVLNTGKNTLILDAYNANPDSLQTAINNFSASAFPAKTLIIGDMLELGEESDIEHSNILKLIGSTGFKDVFLVGPIFTRINSNREWICFQDSTLARIWFEHHRIEGKTILIKGSRGIMLEKLFDTF
jgi:UDP-N-acetylmuramoyl-tripeptide--D-alanyl-D-alanine ligase